MYTSSNTKMETVTAFSEKHIECLVTRDRNFNVISVVLKSGKKQMTLDKRFFYEPHKGNKMVVPYSRENVKRYKIKSKRNTFHMSSDVFDKFMSETKDVLDFCKTNHEKRKKLQADNPGKVFCKIRNEWEDLSFFMKKCVSPALFISLVHEICWYEYHSGYVFLGHCQPDGGLYDYFDGMTEDTKENILDRAFIGLREGNLREICHFLKCDFFPNNLSQVAENYKKMLCESAIHMLRVCWQEKKQPRHYVKEHFGIVDAGHMPIRCNCSYEMMEMM